MSIKTNINLKETTIPIFITIFNKLTVLKKSVQSYYDNIKTPFEIIIHDNGTTYQPTLDWVKSKGFKYYKSENDMLAIAKTVEDWYKTNDAPYYVITDPDISLKGVNGDILEFLAHVLDSHSESVKVGLSLRLDCIPDHYQHKQKVLDWEPKCYKDSLKIEWKHKEYDIYKANIATTFSLYRKQYKFVQCDSGYKSIRTGIPYVAHHLDWYLDLTKLKPDQIHYQKTAERNRAHWSVSL